MKVLLIDDHPLFREGVALLLQPLVEGLQTWEAGSCEEAFDLLARRGSADLVLIDLGLPGITGLEGLTRLRQQHPELPVVVMSSSDDKDTVLAALDAGAMGFIPKSSTSQVMLGALRLILAKGIYLPPSVFLAARSAPTVSPPPAASPGVSAPPPARTPADLGLTPRQAEVLHLLLQGKPAKLIGRQLNLSLSTVKAHTSAVLRALNVTTRTQAVVAAGRMGLRFDEPASP
ncbi:response regulator [Roseateles cellulosilyticus]|uniref:Response regulator transcription factor n=1 Tax=Pelomonas cellulosilytica TaxID=2906762 RepID=A0ABS8XXC8_9BURK|nr:response regulator transcription factor [Pelomonas sp. P8]MCE4556462.1 response regulator transcription factor [Pelomonas sp. P8]